MDKSKLTPSPSADNTLIVERYESGLYGTFGSLLFRGVCLCDTLEPRKCDNSRNSAVEDGSVCPLFITHSPRFGCNLPIFYKMGRSGLRIHAGNRVHETHGCVLVGLRDGRALVNSRRTLSSVIDYIRANSIKYIRFNRVTSDIPDL